MATSESKGRFFLQNESIRIDSHNESNRIDSNRELECSTNTACSKASSLNRQLVKRMIFLPRDAVITRLLLSSCVCSSVTSLYCIAYRNDWTNRAGFWHVGFLPPILHCYKGFRVSQKISVGYFPLKFCPKLWTLNILPGKSTVLSTELVDALYGRVC